MTSEHVRKTGHRVEVLANDETTPFLELPESSLISFFHAQQFFKNQSICIFFFLNSKDLKFNHTLPQILGHHFLPVITLLSPNGFCGVLFSSPAHKLVFTRSPCLPLLRDFVSSQASNVSLQIDISTEMCSGPSSLLKYSLSTQPPYWKSMQQCSNGTPISHIQH